VKGLFNGMPLIGVQVSEAPFESEQEEWRAERAAEQAYIEERGYSLVNEDEMDIDDDNDYGWSGANSSDKEALGSLLEDCLAIRA